MRSWHDVPKFELAPAAGNLAEAKDWPEERAVRAMQPLERRTSLLALAERAFAEVLSSGSIRDRDVGLKNSAFLGRKNVTPQ